MLRRRRKCSWRAAALSAVHRRADSVVVSLDGVVVVVLSFVIVVGVVVLPVDVVLPVVVAVLPVDVVDVMTGVAVVVVTVVVTAVAGVVIDVMAVAGVVTDVVAVAGVVTDVVAVIAVAIDVVTDVVMAVVTGQSTVFDDIPVPPLDIPDDIPVPSPLDILDDIPVPSPLVIPVVSSPLDTLARRHVAYRASTVFRLTSLSMARRSSTTRASDCS